LIFLVFLAGDANAAVSRSWLFAPRDGARREASAPNSDASPSNALEVASHDVVERVETTHVLDRVGHC